MIEMTGEYDFHAPQELIWDMMLDPEVLSRTMPGCETLERVDDNTFQGRLNIRVGPVQGVFQGKVETVELRPPAGFRLIVNGSGPAGVVRGEGNLTLEAIQDTTRLRYDGAVQVSGRIASVGQRVMDSSAKSIVKQSLHNLDQQVQARLQPVAETGRTAAADLPAPAAPDQTAFMLNVTRDVLADLVPDPRRRKALAGLAVAAIVVAAINAFANLVARRVVRMMKNNA
jgi:carbon monoxide dehydrogenase subunit G